jgi:UDP-hydrolysing UDP-N-acetyl-D-glucosamine 2-epimerase
MAKSTGLGLLELPTLFELLKPDVVVTVGDRFETMATAVAGAYMNIPLAHTMGGEVTGTIDESIRHAITKLAHVHFPANQDAADRIIRLGEDPAAVHVVGCPRIDLVAEVIRNGSAALDGDWLDREGVGGHISTDEPFLLVSQHPVTTEYGRAEQQINETLMALEELKMPTVMLWPNVDAGSEDVSRGMRKFRERCKPEYIRFYKNFPVETFLRLMRSAACLVGNSSAFIREGAFIGTPAVNVGSRQDGRERGPNVLDVDCDRAAITAAIRTQIKHGLYPPAHLYGDGKAGARIADLLATAPLHVQKRIQY